MSELYVYWGSLPPWLKTLIPALIGLIPYGYQWLRHRHLETKLKIQDALRIELNTCQKTTSKLTEDHVGLVAQVKATLPQLIQQAQTCPLEQRQAQHEKLAQWLVTWQSPLGDHAAHLARAKQADPENPPQVWLHIALLAAALGNRHAAELLIEDELEMLAKNEHWENNEHAWERLFATIRPRRQEDLESVEYHAHQKGLSALKQADYAMAGKWLRFGLYLAEIVYGSGHPNVGTCLNNLAELYQAQGNYAQAEPLHLRALAIWEQALGEHHPDTATILNNLGELHRLQGNYAQAESLFLRALAIWELAHGEDYPNMASCLNNSALLYYDQGNYAQAEPIFLRALAIRERVLDENHPDLAINLSNLASLYQTLGNYTQAEPLYLRTLAIFVQSLGKDHPNVATALKLLAVLYRATDRQAEAAELDQRAAAIHAIQR